MNTVTNHYHNLKGLAFIYGVSAAAIFTLAIILIVACFYNRRRRPLQTSHHGGGGSVPSDDEEEDSVIIEIGLNEETVKSYPKMIYRQLKLEKGDSVVASSCSICLAEYNDNDMLLLLPECCHFFHLNCIDPWLKLHPSCPICRKSPPETAETATTELRSQRGPLNLWFVPFMQ